MRAILVLLLMSGSALAQSSHGDKRGFIFSAVVPGTVSALPTCNAGSNGTIMKVTDSLSPVGAAIVAGGGAVTVLVHCQSGTGWLVG